MTFLVLRKSILGHRLRTGRDPQGSLFQLSHVTNEEIEAIFETSTFKPIISQENQGIHCRLTEDSVETSERNI